MRPIACLVAVASLCVGAGGAHAQSVFFLRLAPEVGRITVEHTKKVTVQGESSSSISSSSGLALAANLSAGLRLKLPGNWLVGGELEGVVSGRRKLKGAISPTPNGNIHDVWPGQWNFSDLAGVGGNIIFGRRLGDGFSQVYLFGGRRRMSTEFASGWTNPETREPRRRPRAYRKMAVDGRRGNNAGPEVAGRLPSPLSPFAHRLDNR